MFQSGQHQHLSPVLEDDRAGEGVHHRHVVHGPEGVHGMQSVLSTWG